MKIPTFRFSWLEYYSKQNIFLKLLKIQGALLSDEQHKNLIKFLDFL